MAVYFEKVVSGAGLGGKLTLRDMALKALMDIGIEQNAAAKIAVPEMLAWLQKIEDLRSRYDEDPQARRFILLLGKLLAWTSYPAVQNPKGRDLLPEDRYEDYIRYVESRDKAREADYWKCFGNNRLLGFIILFFIYLARWMECLV